MSCLAQPYDLGYFSDWYPLLLALCTRGALITVSMLSRGDLRKRAGRTLRTPAGREGDGFGEAMLFRLVRMGGRYIWGSSMGGNGIDIVLSSICKAHSPQHAPVAD